ncbi:hypothetical protein MCUN1_000943 [Malassezia cuniculi]|uniref:Phosphoribulokinase/uridine kinase domain-containing protein n=1 Tax=Malassezia cuniculi TaxID=948313 RepID=A0AAF0JAA8_9BASI|nr:hypothetical protein MCUN1_000943 [Malassezia cuniculi]
MRNTTPADLAVELARLLELVPHDRRLLVGISGIPGAGKSTLAHAVAAELAKCGIKAAVVGMDGWHYSRAQLDTFADPAHAHARRGAAFTFDADAFVAFVTALRKPGWHRLTAPSFSHADKDPIADAIEITDERIILVEGLYCNLSVPPWNQAAELWDVRWLVSTTKETARERLISRHVASGITNNAHEAAERADGNDLPNGDWILANTYEPIERIAL